MGEALVAVELNGIWKRFPGVIANAGANLHVRSGTVHAVLGENGAGKTTLMNVLAGIYRPDEGTVELDGIEQDFSKPADAIAAGVGMVYQEFRLIPTFTVAENVVLGAATATIAKSKIESDIADLAERFGLHTDPGREIWQLSMGERQRVEILKALWRDAQVLILDEPTAVLTPQEADELGRITGAMAADGRSIIFISHKLDEVKAFCDEATVLRGGKTVAASLPVTELDADKMGELMVGKATAVSQRRVRTTEIGEAPVLTVSDMRVNDLHGRAVVAGVDLVVRPSEIVGIAGVAGNGQRPLADAIAGLIKADKGSVVVGDQDLSASPPRARNTAGLAYVPEDRIGVGLAPRMNVVENAIMRNYRALGSGPLVDRKAASDHAEDLVENFNVKVGQMHAPMAGLSGGNLQRLLVGREIVDEPRVLIAAQPTRGLDVQGVAAIQGILVEQAASGVGILLISEDLEELFALSDRLLVMHEGEVVAEFDPETATRSEVGVAMAGGHAEDAA
ncbi:MAG: ABC transporter ATP-binding protein [Acidimicrobiia bacterium]|nr:ABC transporter ATP-binding protein [Acidimicrobiia bacterium]RZV41816.1 MAG: ABC transporter ATP-binding protein [Acidimicrobiales bacterium]